ncbi:ATPase components of ABC transporters with duplicated ATPase domains [Hathewaya proteolytica DSM 3090]|uniref:ATPase components of ABC transporters with duplicated ATPase domains n=1 Tax=Hathewaya proteolytica DSM 3090 TaxID=1121331 RepID=A0A1M6KYW9_9CLOT|nr:ABC-F family ATP-binding cassette domain-containing protein [Hathewaya proteolytica]SHJ64046.1 ATPase components of ABC transporters with duplicated ATPase domains [Hathewaya proteolytica DSM 3090]
MSILTVEGVSHGFGGRQILENVSFRLLKGEHVGLVGANGEGKSTFINIITGKLSPDEGKVQWCNRITYGYLDQHSELEPNRTINDVLKDAFINMFEMEKDVLQMYEKMATASEDEVNRMMEEVGEIQETLEHNGFYTIDAKIKEVASGLGLTDIGLDKKVNELSGGQRTKVLLTKLLLEQPMILILDEPTNYLDANHVEWLKQYLKEYENAFILVSHEESFMNEVVNMIYHVENCEITRYKGTYEYFLQMKDLKRRQEEHAYEKQKKEIAEMEDFIARNKARFSTKGRAKSREKQLEKMEILDKPKEIIKPTFRFKESRASGKIVIRTKDLVLGYDTELTKPINMVIERGQKIAIKGVNGLGKSTLLKTLLGIIKPYSGDSIQGEYLHVGYFEQESSRDNDNTALEEVWNEFQGLGNGEVRAALAKCGLTTEHIESKMRVLSGGENAKVRLCKLMLKEVNFLVLDEPTNHLDVYAKDELKKAIKQFKGTVLLVSHEPDFYEDIVTEVWNVENWSTKIV